MFFCHNFCVLYLLPVTQDSLNDLWDKLSRKANTGANGESVGPGWLKYEWNDNVWNLDDGKLFIFY